MRQTAGLPHRLEFVRERQGVRWYDDSKATNVGAADKSVRSFAGGVILLLGGYDKNGDFRALAPAMRHRVRCVIAFGKAGSTVAEQLEGTVPLAVAKDLAAAVRSAAEIARRGEIVLLAPACASFDEFRDFGERGDKFRSLVEAL